MTIISVSYGMTFNLGNYQSERIDAEVQPEPGEAPEQAIARARAFVLGQHEAAETERKQAEEIDRLRSRIMSEQYYIEDYGRRLIDQGVTDSYVSDTPPEGLSELALLQWQLKDAKVHHKALNDQLDALRDTKDDPPF
jgi:hypothetical protein